MKYMRMAIAVILTVLLTGCKSAAKPAVTAPTTVATTTTATTTTTTATTTTTTATTKRTRRTKTQKPITPADLDGSYSYMVADGARYQRYVITLDYDAKTVSYEADWGLSIKEMVRIGDVPSEEAAKQMAVDWVTVDKVAYAPHGMETRFAAFIGLTTSGIALENYRVFFTVSEDGTSLTLDRQSGTALPEGMFGVTFLKDKTK